MILLVCRVMRDPSGFIPNPMDRYRQILLPTLRLFQVILTSTTINHQQGAAQVKAQSVAIKMPLFLQFYRLKKLNVRMSCGLKEQRGVNGTDNYLSNYRWSAGFWSRHTHSSFSFSVWMCVFAGSPVADRPCRHHSVPAALSGAQHGSFAGALLAYWHYQ